MNKEKQLCTASILVTEETQQIQVSLEGKVHQGVISILIMMQPPPVSLLEVVDNDTVIFLSSFDSSLSTCAWLLSEAWLWYLPCSITEAADL